MSKKKAKVTLKNIGAFIKGNFLYYSDEWIGSPKHIKEQVAYRIEQCKWDCVPNKSCKECGCNPIKKAFLKESCNKGERFPDLMSKEDWANFKTRRDVTDK